jgi:hypothetical protein
MQDLTKLSIREVWEGYTARSEAVVSLHDETPLDHRDRKLEEYRWGAELQRRLQPATEPLSRHPIRRRAIFMGPDEARGEQAP